MCVARWLSVAALGSALAVTVGCQEPDKLQIERLQGKVQECETENASLRERLANAIRDRDAALARADALQRQVQQLQDQLAQRPTIEVPMPTQAPPSDGWERSGPYDWVALDTDFLFDSGRASLKPEARAKLQQVVAQIQSRYPDKAIWVLGHTDTDPIRRTKELWEDNLDLSANRAMTVFRELTRLGIQPARMIAGGQGEYFPRGSNSDRASKAQNRRVEIIAVPPRPAVGSPVGAADNAFDQQSIALTP